MEKHCTGIWCILHERGGGGPDEDDLVVDRGTAAEAERAAEPEPEAEPTAEAER